MSPFIIYMKGGVASVGEGGVIIYPGGHQEISFEWVLHKVTNNQAEVLVLIKDSSFLIQGGSGA